MLQLLGLRSACRQHHVQALLTLRGFLELLGLLPVIEEITAHQEERRVVFLIHSHSLARSYEQHQSVLEALQILLRHIGRRHEETLVLDLVPAQGEADETDVTSLLTADDGCREG